MNQVKIGSFMKQLRKERDLTQEQIAEQFLVSNRTVSLWENGNNMPDLDMLIEMADFYNVELKELLNGERKGEKMNEEVKETLYLEDVCVVSDVECVLQFTRQSVSCKFVLAQKFA